MDFKWDKRIDEVDYNTADDINAVGEACEQLANEQIMDISLGNSANLLKVIDKNVVIPYADYTYNEQEHEASDFKEGVISEALLKKISDLDIYPLTDIIREMLGIRERTTTLETNAEMRPNKTNIIDKNNPSTTLYPSEKAVYDYVNTELNSGLSQTVSSNAQRVAALEENISAQIEQIDDIETALEETTAIAKQANFAKGYTDYSSLITELNSADAEKYKVGQSFLIVTLNVPDLWVKSVEETSISFEYVDDESIVSELTSSGEIQVGYYKLSMLETLKQDLTNYAKNTDIIKSITLADEEITPDEDRNVDIPLAEPSETEYWLDQDGNKGETILNPGVNGLMSARDKEDLNKYIIFLNDLYSYAYETKDGLDETIQRVNTLESDSSTQGSVDYKIAQAIAAIINNPDETLNSIQELVDWISNHAEDALALQNNVTSNMNKIEDIQLWKNTADSIIGELETDSSTMQQNIADNSRSIEELQTTLGDIETGLDSIIAIQNSLIGGEIV